MHERRHHVGIILCRQSILPVKGDSLDESTQRHKSDLLALRPVALMSFCHLGIASILSALAIKPGINCVVQRRRLVSILGMAASFLGELKRKYSVQAKATADDSSLGIGLQRALTLVRFWIFTLRHRDCSSQLHLAVG